MARATFPTSNRAPLGANTPWNWVDFEAKCRRGTPIATADGRGATRNMSFLSGKRRFTAPMLRMRGADNILAGRRVPTPGSSIRRQLKVHCEPVQ